MNSKTAIRCAVVWLGSLRYHPLMSPNRTAVREATAPVSDELAQLRGGAITAEEYFESRVEAALATIHGLISTEQRELIGQTLRETWSYDPSIQRRMRALAGQSEPKPAT